MTVLDAGRSDVATTIYNLQLGIDKWYARASNEHTTKQDAVHECLAYCGTCWHALLAIHVHSAWSSTSTGNANRIREVVVGPDPQWPGIQSLANVKIIEGTTDNPGAVSALTVEQTMFRILAQDYLLAR